MDRLICQAIAQVLTPIFDPKFHPDSFGFRPGRSQHHAVERARQFISDDAAWCVDFDLDSFFRGHHGKQPAGDDVHAGFCERREVRPLPATVLVVHCKSRRQAEYVRAAIAARMGEVGLRIHPDKTRIVYCKDGRRRGDHEHTSFTFLGFTFRARGARGTKNGRASPGSCPR